MLKISKKSQYGLRAMICLAKSFKSKEVCSVKHISQKEGIPFDFLEKVISILEKEGLVSSKRGVQGGYILNYAPDKITAADVVNSLEGRAAAVDCACCGKSKACLSKNVWRKLEVAFNSTLKSITLADLIK